MHYTEEKDRAAAGAAPSVSRSETLKSAEFHFGDLSLMEGLPRRGAPWETSFGLPHDQLV